MPRVTQRDQYQRHQLLQDIWRHQRRQWIFSDLEPYQQQQIHLFYRPDDFMSFAQFKEHLRTIKAERPGLVHVVGKLVPILLAADARRAAMITMTPAPC